MFPELSEHTFTPPCCCNLLLPSVTLYKFT